MRTNDAHHLATRLNHPKSCHHLQLAKQEASHPQPWVQDDRPAPHRLDVNNGGRLAERLKLDWGAWW